tara:strand:+ start:255 stop:557 length:303 start_codon:yes stop_codon:yes gene_type:complete
MQQRIDAHMGDLITVKHAASMFGYSRNYLAALCRKGMVYGVQGQPGPGWYTGKNGLPVYHSLVSISSLEDHIIRKARIKRGSALRKVMEIKLNKRLDKAA